MSDVSAQGLTRPTIHFPPFHLDVGNERLWRGTELVALRPKTFAVLNYLVERPGQLIRKEELLDRLWGEVVVSDAVLKTYLREIRLALGDSARSPRFIETAHRRGYRFIGRVLNETAPPPAPSFDASDAFVGRTAELARLGAAAATALGGERRVVLVCGEPGIGKTTLVHAFRRRVEHPRQFVCAWGQCVDQYGAGEAYLPLLEAMRRLWRGRDRVVLAEIFRREAPSWLALMPEQAGDETPLGPECRPAQVSSQRMLRELAEALETFTRERPLMLCIEDLHWADPSTLACLAYLARRLDPARLLIIGTYRSVAAHAGTPLASFRAELVSREACEELALGFLSASELERYFARRFPNHRFPRDVLAAAYAQTTGNPMFVERVVDGWVKDGLIARVDGGFELTTGLERLTENAPLSIVASIEREIEALDAFERAVLEAASAAGMDFSTASVAAALDGDLVRVEEVCLRWARRRQFFHALGQVEWPDGTTATRCGFIHALYRQVAYERLGAARRVLVHRRIGGREEAAHGARATDIAAELALHFERGQELSRAIEYLAAAGEQALRRSACKEAIAHFERGLELAPKLGDAHERQQRELALLVALGASLAMTQGHAAPAVERVYSRARALCEVERPTTPLFQAMMGVGAFYLVRGEYRTANAVSEQFLALAAERDAEVLLEAHLLQGMSLLFLGRLREAVAALEASITLYDSERHRGLMFAYMQDPCVCALSLVILPLWISGEPERARACAERALAIARELGHPVAEVLALLSLAQLEVFVGEAGPAREHAERGFALAVQHGFELYEHTLEMQLGAALIAGGDAALGLERMLRGWAALRSSGTELAGTHWRSVLAAGLADAGRVDEACALLVEAITRVESHHERWWEPELYRVLGEVLLRRGGPAASVELGMDGLSGAFDPETCFSKALRLARENGALAFVERAAGSLRALRAARERSPVC